MRWRYIKVNYYADSNCEHGSEKPEDRTQCFRVITLLLAEEY
ncbi:MAG: DUF3768 domain-containing protein [Rhodospirillales bacterium]|nr:DUF3768 domain-containing protein [Rhodospirillales bacterium]